MNCSFYFAKSKKINIIGRDELFENGSFKKHATQLRVKGAFSNALIGA